MRQAASRYERANQRKSGALQRRALRTVSPPCLAAMLRLIWRPGSVHPLPTHLSRATEAPGVAAARNPQVAAARKAADVCAGASRSAQRGCRTKWTRQVGGCGKVQPAPPPAQLKRAGGRTRRLRIDVELSAGYILIAIALQRALSRCCRRHRRRSNLPPNACYLALAGTPPAQMALLSLQQTAMTSPQQMAAAA